MSQELDLRGTLNLPDTSFPMKASLPEREPKTLKFWEDNKIYEKLQKKNAGRQAYILHDGPPYANGHIHIGHALNKILKDIIVKYYSLKGFRAPYVPGWDCHGLPIELQVDKNMGKDKDSVGILEKRKLCREYALEFVNIQREEFKRLGGLGDWENPYLTMAYSYEGATVREFAEFVKKGYVYKGKKPVHWCPSCVTALAEAEVEYNDKTSPSVFVRFKLTGDSASKLGISGKDAYLIIWTTTPWTLPANLALAVGPDVSYTVFSSETDVYIFATELAARMKEKCGLEGSAIKELRGSALVGLKAAHPFIDRESIVIAGDFVTTTEGSGIVHIAPGHGEDDYEAGLKNNLDIYAPVDGKGIFVNTGVEGLDGQFVFKANAYIIELLKQKGALLQSEDYPHSYPHCWRCKKPVIFRATEQWFISMAHNDLRGACMSEIDNTKWVPSWGRERIHGMMKGRPDWCISRQRSWGVPITMIACAKCGKFADDAPALDRIAELVTKNGADIWFTMTEAELLPNGYKCLNCGADSFKKETDILDVWFDSGVSHAAVLKDDPRLEWPADMYLEGSDQHRGWFQSSLLASVGTTGKAPYKTVLTHGFTVDGSGRKMSKSVGNVVAPQDIIKQNGAEILRLWVSAEDYRDDMKISKEIIARMTEAYRKIRNTARFLLGNTSDFDPEADRKLLEIDLWALSRLNRLIKKLDASYANSDFHEVFHGLYGFCVVDLSSFYLDILKDRLYTFAKNSPERRGAQYVLNEILKAMTGLMSPVLSFTAEEIWSHLKRDEESVFLGDFPEADEALIDEELETRWQKLINIRAEVLKALELKRADKFIGNALEAKANLYLDPDGLKFIERYADFLPALFIVSQSEAYPMKDAPADAHKAEGVAVSVVKADGGKCPRCWNISPTVAKRPSGRELCDRCNSFIG